MIRIRVEGTAKEICKFSNQLKDKGFQIIKSSKFYENRETEFVPLTEKVGRIYLEIES